MGFGDDLVQPGDGRPAPALEERVARLERELDALRRQVAASAAGQGVRQVVAETRVPPPPPMPVPQRPEAAAVGVGVPSAAPLTAEGYQNYPSTVATPQAKVPPQQASQQPQRKRDSFEKRLGSQIFNRIGLVILLIGTAYFLKYASDQQWIGPAGRVVAGLAAGAGIVLWSERFRRKGFPAFSYSLKALGSGVLYLSLWAAFHLYQLLAPTTALGLMILVTAWNAWMAWAQDSELLAAYALAGGFVTPILLSTGGNNETFLFAYLLAIDIATVVLVRLRGWPRLLLGAFPLTMVYFIGWYVEHFAASELMLTSVFIVLFDCTFSSVPVGRRPGGGVKPRSNASTLIEDILLPLANSVFLAGGLYSVLQDSGHHDWLPWLMIVLAAVYLVFMRLPQSRTASAIHLSIAVVLLTIAVPLKASGHWITASWLVEGLALLWVATRIAPTGPLQEASEAYAARTLRWLASAALVLGFCGVVLHSPFADIESGLVFFNADTGTALTGVAVFAAAAWLALRVGRAAEGGVVSWPLITIASFVAIDLIAVLLTFRELVITIAVPGMHPPFRSAYFVTALIGLAVFAGVIAVTLRLARERPGETFWIRCAAVSTVAFNLIAVLTGVREVNAIWDFSLASTAANPDSVLEQALAISGFLMLYGAVLLAVGFWKRSAFLRWQALLLLVFTIFKAFLYDMRNLSQGYRVASFLGLGALLMAISFAYQKDWLSLREPLADAAKTDNSEVVR